jgi:hypothetical protein
VVRDVRRRTRKHRATEGKIRTVLEGLRGQQSIAEAAKEVSQPDNLRLGTTAPPSATPPAWHRAPA